MRIELIQTRVQDIEADALVLLGFEGEQPTFEGPVGEWIKQVYASRDFSGKPFELAILHRPPGFRAARLVLAGAGRRDKFNSAEMRKAIAAACRNLKNRGVRRAALAVDGHAPQEVKAAVEGALLGAWEPDQLKTDPKKEECRLEEALVAARGEGLQTAVEHGRIFGEAQNFARQLINLPANRLTPSVLADQARQVAESTSLRCDVLDRARMEQLGMGALLGVARGSDEPPALIVLSYEPEENRFPEQHLALVGKGVTFDSGGISIKPADGMEKMKYDMAGGAAVIAAMQAIARLKPKVRITGLVPAAENMLGGRAQRPGDIVTTLSGKTVEVINTDAEGRLLLIDTFTYALRLGCTHLVDAATLTGAIVVALGHVRAGAFTNNEDFYSRLEEAASSEGERIWRMPLDEDYKEYLRTPFADLPNIGGRWGGAVTAAYFMKEFTEDRPWVHLDIAGVAWLDEAKPFLAKGPTGFCVRTFINLAMNWR